MPMPQSTRHALGSCSAGRLARREFLQRTALCALSGLGAATAVTGCANNDATVVGHATRKQPQRLFFTSAGKTCMIAADGSGFRTLELHAPDQVTWQPVNFMPDGRRVIFLSMEQRRDGPGRPFAEYYHRTPTHLWTYDLESGELTEIVNRERMAPFYTPQLLLGDDRLLVQVVKDGSGQIFSMRLDGTDPRPFTRADEGMPYGLSLSPDGRRVGYHLASPQGYQVWTSDPDGSHRVRIAAHPEHLYFGTSFSPDNQWLLYQDCLYRSDPGHDWSDICIGRVDGSEHRVLTQGQEAWFAATYGPPTKHSGGSNMPMWMPDGTILFSRRLPDSKVPWEFQPQRPDTDHFNRDWKPESSRGGTELCVLNPTSGTRTRITHQEPPLWDFRGCVSPDANLIAFCRCRTGEPSALWTMNLDGTNQRLLSHGLDDSGADHPRWLPRLVR